MAHPRGWLFASSTTSAAGHPGQRDGGISRNGGPGVVSTPANEFGFAVTADGDEVYFGRANAAGVPSVYRSTRTSDGLGAPVSVPLVDEGSAIDPFVSGDGSRLYFSSDAATAAADTSNDMNTWVTQRTGDGWGEPRPLPPPLNSAADEVFVSSTRDGTLYFGRSVPGEPRHFFRAARQGTAFATPSRVKIDAGLSRIGNPAVAPDESFLTFWATTGPEGTGPPDLLVSCRTSDGWGAPWNPGAPVNSAQAEIAPHVSPDGRWLYFTSERPGQVAAPAGDERPPGDIYRFPVAELRPGCPG